MLKNSAYVAVILMSGSLFCTPERYALNKENLLNAIQKEDPVAVQKYLKRLGPIQLSDKNEFVAAADKVITGCEKKVSLIQSPKDAAKCIIGIVLALYGIDNVYKLLTNFNKDYDYDPRHGKVLYDDNHISSFSDEESEDYSRDNSRSKLLKLLWRGSGPACILGGGYLVYDGVTKRSARARLGQARSIKDEINKALLKDGQLQENAQS